MNIAELLVGLGLGAVLVALINAIVQRRKLGADTAAVLSKTALQLVQPLSDRIHELEAEVTLLRDQVRETTGELEACHEREREKDRKIAALLAAETT